MSDSALFTSVENRTVETAGLCRQYASMQLLLLREGRYTSVDMRWLSFSESLTILGS